MKKTSIKYFIGLSTLAILLFCSLFYYQKTALVQKANFETEKYSIEEEEPEESPKGALTEAELFMKNQNAKEAVLKGNLQANDSTIASYANNAVSGKWSNVAFLTDNGNIHSSYGFRVDGSLYDKGNDVIYVISFAGHLYRVDRDENDNSRTKWTLLDNKNNYDSKDHTNKDNQDDMYLYGMNLSDGSFRMIRSRDASLLEYSDDEGRSWKNANVRYEWSCQDAGVAKTSAGIDRIATFASMNTVTRKPYFSTDGITYTPSALSFSRNQYTGHIVKPLQSENIFLFIRNTGTNRMSIYKLGPDDSDYQLVQSPSFTFTNFDNVLGTEINGVTHFTVLGNKHVYYSSDNGANWVTKTTDSGEYPINTMHPTQPNTYFKGYLDINMSRNFGVSYQDFSHRQGWDVQHQRMYEKADGTVFHFVGNDFGAFISYKPEDMFSYIAINNTAPTQMIYDAAHSENYNQSFTALQDRGARKFTLNAESTGTGEIRSTDAFRVTVADQGASIWSWLYFGSLYHQNFAQSSDVETTNISFTGDWWAAPLVASLQKGEDAVYVAAGDKIKKFSYNPSSKEIIQTEHAYDFKAKTGSDVSSLAFSELNPNKWYVTTSDGQFLYSSDNGQSFEISTNIKDFSPKANTQNWGSWRKDQQVIYASKIDENKVYYAGIGNRFYISENGGERFRNHSTGLNVYQIRDFTLTPDEKFIFAAAGTSGAWVFSVAENRWYSMASKYLPVVDYTDVQYLEKTNTVVFGTYGAGLLKFKLDVTEDIIAAPSNLKATNTIGNITITWLDNSDNESNFIIERSTNNEDFTELITLPSNSSSYTDTSLPINAKAIYRVKAIAADEESKYSNYVIAKEDLKKGWKLVSVTSQETVMDGEAEKAWDSDPNTRWHSQWHNITSFVPYPHELVIDMGITTSFKGFNYLPDQGNQNGRFKDYEFYVSLDNVTWKLAAKGTWINSVDNKQVVFSETETARYIKLVGLSEVNGKNHASCAELSIFNKLPTPEAPIIIQAARISESRITINWLDLSDNEKGFRIQEFVNGEFVTLSSMSKNRTSTTIIDLDTNAWHRYRIVSYNDFGESFSNVFDIRGTGENTLSVNIEEISEGNLTKLYPNPFTNNLKVKITGNKNEFTDWALFNSLGSIIKSGKLRDIEKQGINTEDINSGIYFIKLQGNSKSVTKKVIKQ